MGFSEKSIYCYIFLTHFDEKMQNQNDVIAFENRISTGYMVVDLAVEK